MANEVIVYKGRDNTVRVHLGMDVSADTFTSEIRSEPTQEAPLLATWDVDFETDGTDGKLLLTIDATASGQIQANVGYMDLKRVSGGLELAVFEKALEVAFRGTVTV